MTSSRVFPILLLAIAVALACDKTPEEPATPGTAVVSFATPNEDDGGLLLTLRGPGLTAVRSSSSEYVVYWRLVGPEEARVMVLGDILPGPLFTVELAAANRLDEYAASIDQVATRNDALRGGASGYELQLVQQE